MSPEVRKILFVASNCFLISYQAGNEQAEHEVMTCTFDYVDPKPPFLGFEYWGAMGILLAILAIGLIVAAIFVSQREASEPGIFQQSSE